MRLKLRMPKLPKLKTKMIGILVIAAVLLIVLASQMSTDGFQNSTSPAVAAAQTNLANAQVALQQAQAAVPQAQAAVTTKTTAVTQAQAALQAALQAAVAPPSSPPGFPPGLPPGFPPGLPPGFQPQTPRCFPLSATVVTEDGIKTTMGDLKTGDKVLTVDPSSGKKSFSRVYMWGHRDAKSVNTFYDISTESGSKISLSVEHYIYVSEGGCEAASLSSATTLSPGLLKVGQAVWIATSEGMKCTPITDINITEQKGLFNPYTLTGTIIVDGVLASCYSEHQGIPIESTLRIFMNEDSVARNAPALHHALFAPTRQLFNTFGLDWTKRVTSPHEENGWENLTIRGVVTDIIRETLVSAK